MPVKIEVHKVMQLDQDLKTLRKIYQRFSKLKTDTAEDHHAVREFERVFRNLERILNVFRMSDLTIKG
jgi:hypothetical protein